MEQYTFIAVSEDGALFWLDNAQYWEGIIWRVKDALNRGAVNVSIVNRVGFKMWLVEKGHSDQSSEVLVNCVFGVDLDADG